MGACVAYAAPTYPRAQGDRMSSVPVNMADLILNRRIDAPDPDREALEHIARALESRRFQREAQGLSAESDPRPPPFLTAQNLSALLEGIPAAMGILAGG